MPAPGPVFLDNSGRRLRYARVAGFAALTLVAGYVVLFFVAFFGGPDIVAPYLPKPAAVPRAEKPVPNDAPSSTPQPPAGAAAQLGTAPGAGAIPVGQAVQGVPAAPAAQGASPATVAPAAPVAPGAKAQAPATSGSAGQANAAAAPAQGSGQQTLTEPGKSGTAPGQTARPTSPPHP